MKMSQGLRSVDAEHIVQKRSLTGLMWLHPPEAKESKCKYRH